MYIFMRENDCVIWVWNNIFTNENNYYSSQCLCLAIDIHHGAFTALLNEHPALVISVALRSSNILRATSQDKIFTNRSLYSWETPDSTSLFLSISSFKLSAILYFQFFSKHLSISSYETCLPSCSSQLWPSQGWGCWNGRFSHWSHIRWAVDNAIKLQLWITVRINYLFYLTLLA